MEEAAAGPGPSTEQTPEQATAQATQHATEQATEQHTQKVPGVGKKRKYAVFLGYLGVGYHGMQRNPPFPTIEAELESAMHKAGAISEANANSFSKIHWMRAARTDKGVSAACQLVSAKLVMDTPGMVDRINDNLPAQVKVYGYHRCIDGFDARKYCDRRRYEYLLPVWAFDPTMGLSQDERRERRQQQQQGALGASSSSVAEQQAQFATGMPGGEASTSNGTGATATGPLLLQDRLRLLRQEIASSTYVFDEAERARLNTILGGYVGTHNFHNFSVKVDPTRNEARRYMLSFECPGTIMIQGQPWVKMVVLGQSFILHQIRKMVGLALVLHRRQVPSSAIRLALDPDRDYNVPMAPELGLFLDETFYDGYNNRWASLHGALSFEPFRAQAEEFKAERIYPHMASTDEKDMINALWIHNLTDAQYKFSTWAQNPKVRNVRGKKRDIQQTQPVPAVAALAGQNEQQWQQQQQQQPTIDQGQSDGGSAPKRQRVESPATAPVLCTPTLPSEPLPQLPGGETQAEAQTQSQAVVEAVLVAEKKPVPDAKVVQQQMASLYDDDLY